jgi:hypothetical protein
MKEGVGKCKENNKEFKVTKGENRERGGKLKNK